MLSLLEMVNCRLLCLLCCKFVWMINTVPFSHRILPHATNVKESLYRVVSPLSASPLRSIMPHALVSDDVNLHDELYRAS